MAFRLTIFLFAAASLLALHLTFLNRGELVTSMLTFSGGHNNIGSSSSSSSSSSDNLTIGFYNDTCPNAEELVKEAVAKAYANDSGVAAGLIRLHFHDCFVRGCDASVLIDSTSDNLAEKDGPPNNNSLRSFDVIDAAKSAVESNCSLTVSCADILAFAARDSVVLASGNNASYHYQVPAGRRDGNISFANETVSNIPSPLFNSSQLIDNFTAKNLTAEEMVTLSGAHTIGVSRCTSFTNRLYNFNGTNQTDPSLSSGYATLLMNECPTNSTPKKVALDLISPSVFDNKYYVGLQNTLGLLTSDQALMTDESLSAEVNKDAGDLDGWVQRFKDAMVKMGGIEVLTGTQGEIRKDCRVVNSGQNTLLLATY